MRPRITHLGHALLDRQHARLADQVARLHAAIVAGRPARALMTRLLRDTERHFASEDRLMHACGYADIVGHQRLHDAVLIQMQRMRTLQEAGLPLHRKYADQILDWLEHHTGEADRNLVESLARHDAGHDRSARQHRRS